MNIISLEKLLILLCETGNIHICLNDLAGILSHPLFNLSDEYIYHRTRFCNAIKDKFKCEKKCYAYKNELIYKAVTTKTLFESTCPFGVYQLVYPIHLDGKACCVMYVFNVTKNKSKARELFSAQCDKSTESSFIDECINSLSLFTDKEKYENLAKLVENHITLLYEKTKDFPIKHDKSTWVIGKMVNDIKNEFSGNITIKSQAQKYFYNEKYLGRLFKKETGTSFSEYVNKTRLSQAI